MRHSPDKHWLPAQTVFLLLALAPVGCVPMQVVADRKPPPPENRKVVSGGACLELGEAEKAAYTREEFAKQVGELLTAERFETARRFVRRYPDVALDTLRHTTNELAGSSAYRFIAEIHEQQCGTQKTGTWTDLLQERSTNPKRFAAFDTARNQFQELLRQHKVPEALALHLVKAAPVPLLEMDANQLQGEAYLLDEKGTEAAAAFSAALKVAGTGHPYQAAQIMVLLGDAQRRTSKKSEGVATWRQAVLLAGSLLEQPIPVCDPIFWERASYMRPIACGWPESFIKQLVPAGAVPPPPGQPTAKTGVDEAWLWAAIGKWRLERGEGQGALVALKRAESLNLDAHFQDHMQLSQAKALAILQQPASAMALLVQLGSKEDNSMSAPALAMLGAIKLKEGGSQQGLTLLKKAVEQSTSSEWPGHGEAEADLGLAYLMAGDEANGLRCLHAGQRQFETAGALELLVQALGNEANYLDHMKKPDAAAQLRQRMKMLDGVSRPVN